MKLIGKRTKELDQERLNNENLIISIRQLRESEFNIKEEFEKCKKVIETKETIINNLRIN